MSTEVDATVLPGHVARQERDASWWEYHDLVRREVDGRAPAGTVELLARDPFRWAAHLGVAIGVLSDALARGDIHPQYRRSATYIRARLVARKGDVIALRKRMHVEIERDQARDGLQQILTLIDNGPDISDPSNADWQAVRAIAADVIGADQ